jgi:hypothetical protein
MEAKRGPRILVVQVLTLGAEWDDRAFEKSSFEVHELRCCLFREERYTPSDTLTRLMVSTWIELYSSMNLKI